MNKKPSPFIIILCLFGGITISVLLAVIAVQLARTPPPAGTVDPLRLNQSEFRQLGLIPTTPQHYILRLVAKEWFFDVGQTRDAPAIVTISQHSTVTFITTSMDVVHALQIQGNPMVTIVPGKITTQTIVFDTPRTYIIQCAAYCAAKHEQMQLTIIVPPAK
jgi:heme/copper-type cytochrome/quinol oxidase subunit 2